MSFSCPICYTSGYSSEEAMMDHQRRRGHWQLVFDSRRRTIPSLVDDPIIEDDDEAPQFFEFSDDDSETQSSDSEAEASDSDLRDEESPAAAPSSSTDATTSRAVMEITVRESIFDRIKSLPVSEKNLLPNKGKLKSHCWKIFRVENPLIPLTDNNLIICLKCSRKIKRDNLNAKKWFDCSALNSHLKTYNCGGSIQASRTTTDSQSSMRIRTKTQIILPKSKRENEFWEYLAMAFNTGQIPFRFVENIYLKQCFNDFLNARLPNRRQL